LLVKRWIKQEPSQPLREALCAGLSISPATASILLNRGIEGPEEADKFLRASLDDLIEPFELSGMDLVVKRVLQAIKNDEQMLVFGDYDADGITATALLVEFFKDIGKRARYYIPRRLDEGYGISFQSLEKIRNSGVKLIITVDCGVSSVDEIRAAKTMGLDVIVTDHHEPPDVLPDAVAIINPYLKDSNYPFKGLAGVGVALKLAQAVLAGLDGKEKAGPGLDPRLYKYLDLVALGTISDVVPLKGENRILVKHGLEFMKNSSREGIKSLKEVSMVSDSRITAGTVSFKMAPRLNASGRLGEAYLAVKLLLTDNPQEANAIALELDKMNRERQKIEEDILDDARSMVCTDADSGCRAIVLASDQWHQGVIGIVASKLVDEFYMPTVLIAMAEDIGKGSARSIPGFHMQNGLEKCSSHLQAFGGHKFAAGLSICREKLPLFKEDFENLVKNTLTDDDFIPMVRVDSEVRLGELDWKLYDEITSLAPFGAGNPEPVMKAESVEVLYPKMVGRNHVRMRLSQDGFTVGAIGFNMGGIYQSLAMSRILVDAAFSLDINEWQGERRLQLNLKDVHF